MDATNAFATGSGSWLSRLGNLRNVVRQEVVARQLTAHLPMPSGASAIDVGSGQGTQAIRLAREGFEVTAVEPEPRMREACAEALEDETPAVRARVDLRAGGIGDLADVADPGGYQVVLCHGVLMYLDSPVVALTELAGLVGAGGTLSVLTRNAEALAWRPAARHDWRGALELLDEVDRADREHRSPVYRNEIGVDARADWREGLEDLLRSSGLALEAWYGVRIASDNVPVEEPFPQDPEQARALLDLEERFGRTDPYRRMGTLMHLVARRPWPSTTTLL
jgi:SAM-dependent methyltransferase